MTRKDFGFLLLALTLSPAAFGQTFVCPSGPAPGQRQVGTTGGSHGIAAVPVCVQQEAGNAAPSQPAPSPENPLVLLAKSQIALAKEAQEVAEEGRAIQQSDEYKKLREGYWVFSHDTQNPRSGKGCQAFHGSLSGGFQASGPTQFYNGATITLTGPDLPKPSTPVGIRVDLTQDAKPPLNISAISLVSPGSPMGSLTFQVTSAKAMLESMEDLYSVKVAIDGKQVISTSYKDGLKAKEFLRGCLAGRPVK